MPPSTPPAATMTCSCEDEGEEEEEEEEEYGGNRAIATASNILGARAMVCTQVHAASCDARNQMRRVASDDVDATYTPPSARSTTATAVTDSECPVSFAVCTH